MLAIVAAALMLQPTAVAPKRWVWLMTNLLVDDNITKNLSLMERSKKAGYNGVVVTDSKFLRWGAMGPHYLSNAQKFRDGVRKLGMEFVAGVCPIGYSNDLLSLDPNLAEGLRVVNAPFTAVDGKLVPTDTSAKVANGGFEDASGDKPAGWSWIDEPGKISFVDSTEAKEGHRSLRLENFMGGNGRAVQSLKLVPFHNYHLSAWVKTKDFDNPGNVEAKVLVGDRSLQFQRLPIERTMDWKRVDVTFNSLENSAANLYLGVWGGGGGKIWWDDVRIEPAGLTNLIRRPSTPVVVTSEDGSRKFEEGVDFDGAKDPKMGNINWSGDYNAWHESPVMNLPPGSKIRPGQRVLVSSTHVAMVYDSQVTVCMAEPKLYDLLRQTVQEMHANLHPDGYFLQHDEIRATGYDAGCVASGKTPGQLLAENVRRCAQMVRKEDPGKTVYAWSDMFDPIHNALDKGPYYLVKGDGPWRGSWEGLDKDVVIVNWNSGPAQRRPSAEFFANRGHHQILAGYYDGPVENTLQWRTDLKGIKGIDGVMYTTWASNFGDLERFAEQLWGK